MIYSINIYHIINIKNFFFENICIFLYEKLDSKSQTLKAQIRGGDVVIVMSRMSLCLQLVCPAALQHVY